MQEVVLGQVLKGKLKWPSMMVIVLNYPHEMIVVKRRGHKFHHECKAMYSCGWSKLYLTHLIERLV